MTDWTNQLYFGDNLSVLREHIPDESVDLIYLDPPFNSNATYNVLFKERSGEDSAAQITAFDDTWHWTMDSERAYQEVVTEGPDKLGKLLQAMREFLGQNDMMAYLTMMAQRLAELHRVLKPTGQHLPALRPDGESLSQAGHRWMPVFGQAIASETRLEHWKRYGAHNDVGPALYMAQPHFPVAFTTSCCCPIGTRSLRKSFRNQGEMLVRQLLGRNSMWLPRY